MKHQNLPFIAILFFIGCQNSNNTNTTQTTIVNDSLTDYSLAMSNTDTYVKAAFEICECMRPMVDKVNEIKSLQSNNNSKAVIQKENELKEIRFQVDSCSTEIRNKYSQMNNPKEKKKLLAALKQYCPESYEIVD